MTIQQMQAGFTFAPPSGGLETLLQGLSTTLGGPDLRALARDIAAMSAGDPAGASALLVAVEGRLTPVQAGELRSSLAAAFEGEGTGGAAVRAPLRFAQFGGAADARIPREYTLEGVVGTIERGVADRASAAASAAREATLDVTVGAPMRATEAVFNRTGHADAATLLREFRTGEGPQRREFGPTHVFTRGFESSSTTRHHVQTALAQWNSRPGGLQANGGRYTEYRGTFVPIDTSPNTSISAEAHVIGSFRLDARLVESGIVEWRATNEMSLRSYFGDNWTRTVGVSIVDNNVRPEAYGNTSQTITWRTDLNGVAVR